MDDVIKDALETIGINVVPDGYTDSDGCWYDNDTAELWDAIWCGVFGFCGCGDVGEQFDRLLKVLHLLDNNDKRHEERIRNITELNKRPDLHIYLYILDDKDFSEHGGSVLGSWLTEKGVALLRVLEYIEEHDEYDNE